MVGPTDKLVGKEGRGRHENATRMLCVIREGTALVETRRAFKEPELSSCLRSAREFHEIFVWR
jgi:hypothetical protein